MPRVLHSGEFNFKKRRVLWKNSHGSIQVKSLYDGTGRLVYVERTRCLVTGLDLEYPETLGVFSPCDLAEIITAIEHDAVASRRYKNQAVDRGEEYF